MRILKVVLALLCSSGIFANLTPSIYYHHPDHLGSATWITDMNGTPIQYLHYMPYGETFAEQSVTPYRERFRFTGKYSKMNKHTLPFRERLGERLVRSSITARSTSSVTATCSSKSMTRPILSPVRK